MQDIENPFIVQGAIVPEYFCDRVKESAKLINSVTNGNNIVLLSQRRMGKTGLIGFCFENKNIKKNYHTVFVDILHTASLKEFTYILGREIFASLVPRGRKILLEFVSAVKSLSGIFGIDAVSGLPTFNVLLGDLQSPELTLAEIFNYLNTASKPCIVAIDEFQQISYYEEKNVEALLRGHMQKVRNCRFIFAGSELHLMTEMFNNQARPFYSSADMLELKAIASESYIPFVVKNFEKFNRKILPQDAQSVYNLFKGHTFYMQKTFNEAFSYTPRRGKCTRETLTEAIRNIVESYDSFFRETLSTVPEKQKELLYAIAQEGLVTGITSEKFLKKYRLPSTSSVQASTKQLQAKGLITRIGQTYSLNNKFFALWINNLYGSGWTLP